MYRLLFLALLETIQVEHSWVFARSLLPNFKRSETCLFEATVNFSKEIRESFRL